MAKPLVSKAKQLRSNQTEAEHRLWYHLRAHRFQGTKFKRQKPIGPYIVDFVCVERRLIVELDGGQHSGQVEYDRQRDTWLHGHGYRVLRFWNTQVVLELQGELEAIARELEAPSPPAPLLLAGEGAKKSKPASGLIFLLVSGPAGTLRASKFTADGHPPSIWLGPAAFSIGPKYIST